MEGVTQLEYLVELGAQLTREAREVLHNFLDKWEWEEPTNSNDEEALKREVARALWRAWYTDTQDDPHLFG